MTETSPESAVRAVAREGEQYMNRLADRLGDLGDDARNWAKKYGAHADHARSS